LIIKTIKIKTKNLELEAYLFIYESCALLQLNPIHQNSGILKVIKPRTPNLSQSILKLEAYLFIYDVLFFPSLPHK